MIKTLEEHLKKALQELGHEYPADVVVSEPPHHVKCDFAVNVALQVARAAKGNPREIAEQVKEKLLATGAFTDIEIAGPGFLNLSVQDAAYTDAVDRLINPVLIDYVQQKVVVEYISANPTGPLHIGNARGGPIGETIARILEWRMNTVQRNFYVNDVGGQANTFAASVLHFYKLHFGQPSELPERGYATPNVRELAEEIAGAEGDRLLALPEHEQQEAMRELSITRQVAKIRATAERTGIHFDSWSNQSELITSGRSAKTLEILKEQGKTIEKEGALWLAGVEEDDRESVLVKSDGTNTYFLDDIAFYRMKLEEWGNDYGICVLGGNHFGHIPRMQAALAALGMDAARYKGTLYQQVQLKEGGERKTMSKREGNFVTADEVLDQIPLDVFNWFMLSKTAETHLDFDLQLAKDTSEKNPVYYVQYAHARICSVLERAGEYDKNITMTETYNPEERSLIRHLSNFTAVLEDIAFSYRTHLLPTYIFELATRYHHFYAHHRVMADEPATAALRIRLSELTAKTLKQGLELLNISAPTHMER